MSAIATDTPDALKQGRLARLGVYFLRYKWWFLGGTVFLVATNLLALWIPRQIGGAIGSLMQSQSDGTPVEVDAIKRYALTIAALALLACFARICSRVLIFFAGRLIEYDMRNELFEQLTQLDADWYQQQSTGDLISRIINDVNSVRAMYGFSALNLVNTLITYTAVLSFMFSVSPKMTWLSLAPYPFIILTMSLFTRALYVRTQASQAQLAEVSAHAQEGLAGVQVVRTFAIEDEMNARFGAASDEYAHRNVRLAYVRGALFPFVASIGSIGGLIILWFGGLSVIQGGAGDISLGEFVEFSAYITALAWPTAGLGWSLTVWQRGIAGFDRLSLILQTAPKVADKIEGSSLQPMTPEVQKALRSDITFENVTLRWEDGSCGLQDISVRIPAGSFTAIVGRTGAGKTSLAELLVRLRDPSEGTIRLGETPIEDIPLAQLRSRIGFVPQDAFLFSRSVRDNIEFGRLAHQERGTPWKSSVQLEDAIRIATLDEAIVDFEEGIDTMVGERGITLSGGQKQRVTIARAVLLDPDILILDDALASVDTRTEHRILQELAQIMDGRTTILITHRFNALTLADKILVMEDGILVEEGTHKELLERGGVYADMVERQRIEEDLSQ